MTPEMLAKGWKNIAACQEGLGLDNVESRVK
jgi:hypothetical protein